MQFSHAVHCMTADTRQVRHAHVALAAFVDQRHARDAILLAVEADAHLVQKARIDLADDFEMPRQQPAEQRQRPAFECFGQ